MWNGYNGYMSQTGNPYYNGGGRYMGNRPQSYINNRLQNNFANQYGNPAFDYMPMGFGSSQIRPYVPGPRKHGPQHSHTKGNWAPDPDVAGNHYPYPKHQLTNARITLIQVLRDSQSLTLQRLKPSFGLDSFCGHAEPLQPLVGNPTGSQNIGDSDRTWHISYEEMQQLKPPFPNCPARLQNQEEPQDDPKYDSLLDADAAEDSGIFDAPSTKSDKSDSMNTTSTPISTVPSFESFSVDSPFPSTSFSTLAIKANAKRPGTNMQPSYEMDSKSQEDPIQDVKRQKLLSADDSLLTEPKKSFVHQPKILIYKCDFCKFSATDIPPLEQHLADAKHYSGSSYNSCSGKIISIEKMLIAKNKHSATKTLLVVCPDCQELFEDIFMCATHHKYLHGSEMGMYSLCPVIYHETVLFNEQPTCLSCGESFELQKSLHHHWGRFPDHHPVKKPASSNVFVLHICPYCSKIFYNNLLLCKTHVLAHRREFHGKNQFAVEVKHILQPLRKLELPPFNTESKDGLENELTILKNIRKFYHNITGSRQKSRQLGLKERIKYLHLLTQKNY